MNPIPYVTDLALSRRLEQKGFLVDTAADGRVPVGRSGADRPHPHDERLRNA